MFEISYGCFTDRMIDTIPDTFYLLKTVNYTGISKLKSEKMLDMSTVFSNLVKSFCSNENFTRHETVNLFCTRELVNVSLNSMWQVK